MTKSIFGVTNAVQMLNCFQHGYRVNLSINCYTYLKARGINKQRLLKANNISRHHRMPKPGPASKMNVPNFYRFLKSKKKIQLILNKRGYSMTHAVIHKPAPIEVCYTQRKFCIQLKIYVENHVYINFTKQLQFYHVLKTMVKRPFQNH